MWESDLNSLSVFVATVQSLTQEKPAGGCHAASRNSGDKTQAQPI